MHGYNRTQLGRIEQPDWSVGGKQNYLESSYVEWSHLIGQLEDSISSRASEEGTTQGRRKHSGWSGFGLTTFIEKLATPT